jgi:hypothetical protein
MHTVQKMQVNITFDTEREPISNLKKLKDAITQLIINREQSHSQLNPLQQRAAQLYSPKPKVQMIKNASQHNPPHEVETLKIKASQLEKQKTGGGCRVVPYEDMSDKMASIFSGGRI